MRIGELARRCNTSERMLRFYEELKLLRPTRSSSGYRQYDEADAEFVRKIMLLNQAGLALKDIALLRDCLHDEPQNFCDTLRGKLKERQADIDRQIRALKQSKALIGSLLQAEACSQAHRPR